MRVVMVNCFGDTNKGDSAMLLGAVTAFRRAFPGCQIVLVSGYWHGDTLFADFLRETKALLPDLQALPGSIPTGENRNLHKILPRPVAEPLRMTWRLWEAFHSLVPLVLTTRGGELLRHIQQADLVVSAPGIYFPIVEPSLTSSFRGLLGGFYTYAYPLLLARRLGKPFVIFCQSAGHTGSLYGNFLLRRATRWLLGHAAYITLREEYSREELMKCGLRPELLQVFPDAAFAMEPSPPENVQALLLKHGLEREKSLWRYRSNRGESTAKRSISSTSKRRPMP